MPEIRLLHLGDFLLGPFLLRRRRRVDRHRFDGERGDERRERLLARRRRRRVHATAGRADVSGAARLPRACQPRCQRRPHPLAHRAASCPSDAAPVRPASRGVLSRPASRVGGAPGERRLRPPPTLRRRSRGSSPDGIGALSARRRAVGSAFRTGTRLRRLFSVGARRRVGGAPW